MLGGGCGSAGKPSQPKFSWRMQICARDNGKLRDKILGTGQLVSILATSLEAFNQPTLLQSLTIVHLLFLGELNLLLIAVTTTSCRSTLQVSLNERYLTLTATDILILEVIEI